MEEVLLRNLESRYPSIACKVESYQPISCYELVVKTTDEERYLYDDEWGTIRKLPTNMSDLDCDDISTEFGYTLKRLMRRRGLGQQDLSELSGITQRSISLYINGKRSPTLITLHKLARALNCDIEELIHVK